MSALPPIATTKADMPVAKGGKVMDGRLSDKQVARTIEAFAARLGLDQSGHKSMDTLRGCSQRGDFPGSLWAQGFNESAL